MTSQIRDVKEATDIVQIIGEKIQLQKSGRNFRALCPFHSEKSPSFYISPDIQAYRCFGCGEKGDVFTFLQRYEGLTFVESLKHLADRAGILLQQTTFAPEDQTRERIFEILKLAAAYYHFLLTTHEAGAQGRAYLEERKVYSETIKEFQLGYALPSWDGLIKYLVIKKKYSILDLEAAGLVILRSSLNQKTTNPRDYYDRFRNRVIFPLTDHRGRVVGFSGRTLEKDTKEAKYINSPETTLYHKSQLLFGYSQLYRSIREANSVVVVEGEFDVLSSVQAHVRNVVAIKGSALTKEHVQRLQQTVETIVLSLDADAAGQEATRRAIEIARQFDVRIRVLPATALGGKDPDDFARLHPKEWRAHVQSSQSAYQFLIDSIVRQHDIQTGEGKQAVIKALAPIIMTIPHAVEKDHYIQVIARTLRVSESLIQQDLSAAQRTQTITQGHADRPAATAESSVAPPQTTREQLESYVLSTLFQFPESEIVAMSHHVHADEIEHVGLRRIVEHVQHWQGPMKIAAFVRVVPAELESVFSTVYLGSTGTTVPTEKEYQASLTRHRQLVLQEKSKALALQLEILDAIEQKTPEQEAQQTAVLEQIVALRQSSTTLR